jgi:1-acyl-sn-glycerol-3-phosphate acyltransferase
VLLIRSLLFYVGLGVSTLVFGPVCVLLFPLPFKARYLVMTRWTAFNLWWLRVTCNLRYIVEGQENIPGTPVVIMCKHQSTFETLALQLIFVPQVWVLKRELLWIPVYGWGLASMEPISIDRGSALKSFRRIVSEGQKRLRQGTSVVIFPEGSRIAPGEKGKYLPGGALLATKSGHAVIPVAHNAGYFWPRRQLVKHPGVIEMVIGPPIEPGGKSAGEVNAEVENWIESAMKTLPVRDLHT